MLTSDFLPRDNLCHMLKIRIIPEDPEPHPGRQSLQFSGSSPVGPGPSLCSGWDVLSFRSGLKRSFLMKLTVRAGSHVTLSQEQFVPSLWVQLCLLKGIPLCCCLVHAWTEGLVGILLTCDLCLRLFTTKRPGVTFFKVERANVNPSDTWETETDPWLKQPHSRFLNVLLCLIMF